MNLVTCEKGWCCGMKLLKKRSVSVALLLLAVFCVLCCFPTTALAYQGDYYNVAAEKEDAVITLDGNGGILSDSTRGQSGNPVIIERKGVYRISGQAEDVTILIREPKKSGNIYLILDHAFLVNSTAPCIQAEAAEKVILQCVGENSLTCTSEDAAAVFSNDDLTVNGTGRLRIASGKYGIHCTGTLRITGAVLSVEAENDGLKGKYGICIDGGKTTVTKSYEGLEAAQVVMRSGELSVRASDDGINASGKDDIQGDVLIQGGSLTIRADGDAIDSNRSILIEGGTVLVEGPMNGRNSIFDRGDSSDAVMSISGGTVLAVGSANKAKNFEHGTQYSRLEMISGHAGDVISLDDGTGLSLTVSRDYECVIASSPSFTESSRIIVSGADSSAVPAEWELARQTELSEEQQTLFSEALERLTGVNYEPLTFLGAKGDLHCFLCRATVVYPEATPYYALVYIRSVDGKAEISEIRELELEPGP